VTTDPQSAHPKPRLRVGPGAVVVLLLVGLGIAVLVTAFTGRDGTKEVAAPSVVSSSAPSGTIFVHILGAVVDPGLYELREGDRAVDAVAAAGGFAEQADQAQLNLARFVVDGEQIYVPAQGEMTSAPGASTDGKVNLNTADQAALETLPRVGPALAQRILDWRETNGRFSAIEDLMSVTGIGDKTFEGLKDLVTI
jgi:competence protein ComEA